MTTLRTSSGLRLDIADDGDVRIGTDGHTDWLGPGSWTSSTAAARLTHERNADAMILRIEATSSLSAATAGGFADVGVGVRFDPAARSTGAWPAGMRAFGHQYTEFGLPTQAGEDLDRWFLLPFRPNVVWPLWLSAPEGDTVLLAPLDSFHEQVITVPTRDRPGAGIVWGWHGDLDEVPAGFSSSMVVLRGPSPRALVEQWVGMLDVAPRHPVDHDTLGRSVSYWTDNGAAYWYRTEQNDDGTPRTVTETLAAAVAAVEETGTTIGAVQLDSWFYPHESTRPFDTDEWVVPPSGLLDWSPRADILPDGIAPLRAAVGDRPLVTHCRHLSAASPWVDEVECWTDVAHAHPKGRDYYDTLLERAASWGVETFEHDWLIECFLGVGGLRAAPGRARDWQEGLDTAAAERDMTLQWCMASPADLFQTASLRQVTSIRTSGDHGYLVGPGFLWAWFCYSNVLARAFGLAPFKDVFLSGSEHGEVEALLSALSTGPVGVGDAIGTSDGAVIAATCRADGVIVRPDVPIAAVDACYRDHAVARPVPLVADCHTDHTAGRWTQVFCANTFRGEEPVQGTVDLGGAWPSGPVVALDLRTGEVSRPDSGWDVDLQPGTWSHHLLAPLLAGDLAVFGDTSKHAPVGRARIADVVAADGAVSIPVSGEGEIVSIRGWSANAVTATIDGRSTPVHAAGEGTWSVDVPGGSTVLVSV